MTLSDLEKQFHLNNEEKKVFRDYTANRFADAEEHSAPEPAFLEIWEKILVYAEQVGAAEAINRMVCPARPTTFRSPETVKIELYPSAFGRIPVIYVRDTVDFEQLVTNVAFKGIRPESLEATGAFFLSGKSTRFIILSAKPYSNVSAEEMHLADENEWLEKSVLIRRGHECTHFFTKQTYGIINNNLHDEIMADFIGIYDAFGFYKAEWFLRFLGIAEGSGSRLIVYTRTLPVRVREAIEELAVQAAKRLEKWSETAAFRNMTSAERIKYMCKAGLEGLIRNYPPE